MSIRKSVCAGLVTVSLFVAFASVAQAPVAEAPKLETIKLNAPQLDKGAPTMQALKNRKSVKEFTEEKLSLQQLSEVLWAANGINREPDKRTAPSALSTYSVDIYVVLEEGVYKYDVPKHELVPIAAGDFRKQAGGQDFVHIAPLNLVYVADLSRMTGRAADAPQEEKQRWAAIETGAQAQNVYLYCASEGLGAVIRASVDKEAFAQTAQLTGEQVIVAAQTVGHSK